MRNKIVGGLIILLLIGAVIFQVLSSKTVYNDTSVLGNTSGNLMNNGLFCEADNKIYFANSNDEGSLYVMNADGNNFKKLHMDVVSHLNVAGKYIFYARRNNTLEVSKENFFTLNKTGMYRMERNGKNTVSLYSSAVGGLLLAGNDIYYQHYEKKSGVQFYKVKLDRTEETKLNDENILPYAVANNTLYYIGTRREHNIHTMDLTSQQTSILKEGNFSHLIVNNDYIYYYDLNQNRAICRMKLDGSNPTTLVKTPCITYNISLGDGYLYYQTDEGEKSRLCRYNITTQKEDTLMEGSFHNIHVTTRFVFFQDFDTNETYMLSSGTDGTVSKFEPPILK